MATLDHIVVVLAVLAIMLLPTTTEATDYVVGDGSGWTLDFDYQAWANSKTFKVGDNLVMLPASTMAAEYVVGGDSGWTTDYNYTAWAQGKVFYVGDKLVFNYPKDVHDVYKVDAASFASCTVPPGTGLTSGNDVVTLMTSGKKWYICGVGNHCAERLQKLVINVEGMTPAPAPSSATKYAYQSFMALIVVLALTVIF
ncbi:blue copper protein-like protein [Tanacetum coccineum]